MFARWLSGSEATEQLQRELKLTQDVNKLNNQLLQQKEQTIAVKDRTIAAREQTIKQLTAGTSVKRHLSSLTHAHKRACTALMNSQGIALLDRDELLIRVFAFIGLKDWFYSAGISRRFRGLYFSFCKRAVTQQAPIYQTDWRNAVVSVPRLELALASGLSTAVFQLPASAFGAHIIACSAEPILVLTACKARDLPWTAELALAAAQNLHRKTPLMLQWIIESGCPWVSFDVMRAVVLSRICCTYKLAMLQWLWSKKPELLNEHKRLLLQGAAIENDLDCVKWLKATVGAAWPLKFYLRATGSEHVDLSGPPVRGAVLCWSLDCFRWARASGSDAPWGNWRCQMYHAAWYTEGWYARQAKRIFTWAHANGCPCTCEVIE